MLRAGQLRFSKVTFYKLEGSRNKYGEIERDEYVELFTCRVDKKTRYARVYKDDLKAKEDFFASSLALTVRWHPLLDKARALRFEGELFSIIYKDSNYDGSFTIGTKKIDE